MRAPRSIPPKTVPVLDAIASAPNSNSAASLLHAELSRAERCSLTSYGESFRRRGPLLERRSSRSRSRSSSPPILQLRWRARRPIRKLSRPFRTELGLDEPVYVQYARYLDRAIHGDLGRSYIRRENVTSLIIDRFPATALLAGAADGVVADSWNRDGRDCRRVSRPRRRQLAAGHFAGARVDSRVLAGHDAAESRSPPLFARFRSGGYSGATSLILPTLTLALGSAGYYSRVLHTSLCDVVDQDYVRTARGKGLSRTRVMLRHAMANALLPLVTLAGLDLAGLLSGVVLTETVFNWRESAVSPPTRSSISTSR